MDKQICLTSLKWGAISGGVVLALGFFILSTFVIADIQVNAENITDLKVIDSKILEKIDNIESNISKIDNRLSNLEDRFGVLEDKFDNLESKLDIVISKLS